MNTEITYIIGQILGFVAVIFGFLSFQAKTDKKLLLVNMITCIIFSTHYFLLGAYPAAVLNGTGLLRNIAYYNKDKKFYSPKFTPIFFAVLMLICGVFSWNGAHSILVIMGLVINTLCMSFKDPQNIRKSILVTSPMVLVYDIFEFSIGGMIFETVVIISSIVGLYRYSKKKSEK